MSRNGSIIQSIYEPQVQPSMKTKNSINLGEVFILIDYSVTFIKGCTPVLTIETSKENKNTSVRNVEILSRLPNKKYLIKLRCCLLDLSNDISYHYIYHFLVFLIIIPILFSTYSKSQSSLTNCSIIPCNSPIHHLIIVHLDISISYLSDLYRWSINFPKNMFFTFIT